jgi:hypothetical protein
VGIPPGLEETYGR